MILLDTLLMGGIRFVLDRVAQAVDREINDETFLRGESEFARLEKDLLGRLAP